MATSTIANTNNFIRWRKTDSLTLDDYLSNGVPALVDNVNGGTVTEFTDLWAQRNNKACYMLQGSTFTSFANINTLEIDTNFANWRLLLVGTAPTGRFVDVDLGNVFTQYIISGLNYRFSLSFTVPILVFSCYELAIVDDSDDVLYVSNEIGYAAQLKRGLQQFRFRNNEDRNNYNYTLTNDDFYNQYYVDTWERAAQDPTVREGYNLSTGAFKNVRDTSGRNWEFITQAYTLEDHEAFKIMCLHSTLQLAYLGNWTKVSMPEGSGYEYEFQDTRDKLADGGVVLEQDDTFGSNTSFDDTDNLWILADGTWNDSNFWVDTAVWID